MKVVVGSEKGVRQPGEHKERHHGELDDEQFARVVNHLGVIHRSHPLCT